MAAPTTDAAPLPTAEEAAAAAAEAAAAAAEAEAIAKEAKEVDTSNPSAAPDRVKRAEAVLRLRTDRVAVVLECPASDMNQQAVLRTAEALGIQTVYVVCTPEERKKKLTKGMAELFANSTPMSSQKWLTIKLYQDVPSCIRGMREDGRVIWATDLSQQAVPLASTAEMAVAHARLAPKLGEAIEPPASRPAGALGVALAHGMQVPPKLAVVVGRETDGVSPAMLAAADARVYLPMYGFVESYNLSVATAMVLMRVLDAVPEARGDLSEETKDTLRNDWYPALGRTHAAKVSCAAWRDAASEGRCPEPLSDLRRSTANKVARISRKVRRREEKDGDISKRDAIVEAVQAADTVAVPGAAKRPRASEGAADVAAGTAAGAAGAAADGSG